MPAPAAAQSPAPPPARSTVEGVLDRLHARAVAAPWLRLLTALTRGLLAVGFLPPGLKKVLGMPFSTLPASTPVGAFFTAFFQAPGYYRLVGVVQVAAALLLLVPRTAPLGAVLYFPVIVNIFAITVSIGFGGTPVVTGAMLLANAYLLAWDYDRWKALLPGFGPAAAPPDPARDLGAGWIAVAGVAGLAAFGAAAVGASALAGGAGGVRRWLLAGACLATALALTGVLVRRHVRPAPRGGAAGGVVLAAALLLAWPVRASAQPSAPAQAPAGAPSTAARPPLGAAARAYLAAALDTLEAVALRRDTISWRQVRDSAFLLAAGAEAPRDTYGAVAWALRRVNAHAFLQAAPPGAVSRLLPARIGYVRVPSWSGDGTALADSLQTAIRALEAAGACGWIVDVRANGGGNMWPMLAGIGPLLGDSLVGAFGTAPDADRWYYHAGVAGIRYADGRLDTASRAPGAHVQPRHPMAPVAVLIDGGTASSGEAIALAFRGRPDTRSFGAPTAGFATANRGAALADGANMVVTTGFMVDRRGVEAGERLHPDEPVPGPPSGWPFATDAVAAAATRWLAERQGCQDVRRRPERGPTGAPR